MKGQERFSIEIFENAGEIAHYLALRLKEEAGEKNIFSIALPGGNTPKIIFQYLAENPLREEINWENIHFFWSDERCVSPDNFESNYGMAFLSLLNKLPVHQENIHRVIGENNPETEAIRYSEEIRKALRENENNVPCFDWILLGLGSDGHTASIFPGADTIINSDLICEVAEHPSTHQKRITFTPKIINNAKNIIFIVTGKDKAKIVSEVINSKNEYPASIIKPVNGDLFWLLDRESFYKRID